MDIVLAIPTNMAACNQYNRDLAYTTSGNATGTGSMSIDSLGFITSTARIETPIHQMGQACKNFVKDNFYHTRGVNMGLIPYSGKVSLSPDVAKGWTVAIPAFNDSAINTQEMMTACLYGTCVWSHIVVRRDIC